MGKFHGFPLKMGDFTSVYFFPFNFIRNVNNFFVNLCIAACIPLLVLNCCWRPTFNFIRHVNNFFVSLCIAACIPLLALNCCWRPTFAMPNVPYLPGFITFVWLPIVGSVLLLLESLLLLTLMMVSLLLLALLMLSMLLLAFLLLLASLMLVTYTRNFLLPLLRTLLLPMFFCCWLSARKSLLSLTFLTLLASLLPLAVMLSLTSTGRNVRILGQL